MVIYTRTLASIIVEIVYGFKIESMDDEYIKAATDTMFVLSETRTPGKFWIDFMPWLRYVPAWVPGTTAVRFGHYWHPKIEKMINTPFDAILEGTVSSRFTSISLVLMVYQNTNACMACELIMKLKDEENSEVRVEEEIKARHATAVAYSGKLVLTFSHRYTTCSSLYSCCGYGLFRKLSWIATTLD
jgi:hypothetical protein